MLPGRQAWWKSEFKKAGSSLNENIDKALSLWRRDKKSVRDQLG